MSIIPKLQRRQSRCKGVSLSCWETTLWKHIEISAQSRSWHKTCASRSGFYSCLEVELNLTSTESTVRLWHVRYEFWNDTFRAILDEHYFDGFCGSQVNSVIGLNSSEFNGSKNRLLNSCTAQCLLFCFWSGFTNFFPLELILHQIFTGNRLLSHIEIIRQIVWLNSLNIRGKRARNLSS